MFGLLIARIKLIKKGVKNSERREKPGSPKAR